MGLEREDGYYWVKTKEKVWHIAHWNRVGNSMTEFYWTVCWTKFPMYDEDFFEIDEKRIIYEKDKVLN